MNWFIGVVVFVAITVLVWRQVSRFWLQQGYGPLSSHGSSLLIGCCLAGLAVSVMSRVVEIASKPDPAEWQVSAGISQRITASKGDALPTVVAIKAGAGDQVVATPPTIAVAVATIKATPSPTKPTSSDVAVSPLKAAETALDAKSNAKGSDKGDTQESDEEPLAVASPEPEDPKANAAVSSGLDEEKPAEKEFDLAVATRSWCDYLVNKDLLASKVSDQFGYSPSEGIQLGDTVSLIYTTPYTVMKEGNAVAKKLPFDSNIKVTKRYRNDQGEIVYEVVLPNKSKGVFRSSSLSWYDTADQFARFDERRQQWLKEAQAKAEIALLKPYQFDSVDQLKSKLGKRAGTCFK